MSAHTIKTWQERTRATAGPFAEYARDAEISDLRARIAELEAVSPDPEVEANVTLLRQRSIVGIAKYGVTLADNNLLELRDWLNHALEESLDMSNYLQAAMLKIDGHVIVPNGAL